MERIEKRMDAIGVVVDERLAADHAVADEQGVARDVLERGHIHRERRSEQREQHDLDLECLLDSGAPRKAEHPIVVDDRYLEVVPDVDLANRPRTVSERVRDQPPAVGGHSLTRYPTANASITASAINRMGRPDV